MLTDTLKALSEKLNFATAPVSKKRQILVDIHGAHCFYCGDMPDYYEVDHVHPQSRGGDDTLNNMVLSCVSCNQTKGGCGINNMNDSPRWLKEAVLHTLRLLYPYSEKKFSYTPSGRYHLNGDAPVITPKITKITEFGQLIERHRVASGLTKRGILKRLNCFEKKWNNYLTRQTIFGESQLPALSKLLSIPMDILFKAYVSDTFEYALQRPLLSAIWKKEHLQHFIETCDIENRWRVFLDENQIQIPSKSPIYGISSRLKIGRPPGKRGRDRIKKEIGFEVFPTQKIQAFQKELKYQPPPIEKVSIPTRIEKASIPTRIEKAPIPPVRPNPPKPGPTPEERAAIRQRKSRAMRARAVLNADLSKCRTEFGKALRIARIQKEMSQPELAKELGLSHSRISDLETGFSVPCTLTAYRLKKALGLPEEVMPPIDVSMCPTEQGKALREYRIKEGLTLRQFALLLGVHPATYNKYEIRGSTPEPKTQKKINALLEKNLPKTKRSPNFNWTPERIETLKKGIAAGKSDTEIAAELKAATHQVQQYRKKHLKIDYSKTWTPEDVAALKKHIANGRPLEKIAALMNRTVSSLQSKKEKLKLRYEPVIISKHCPKTVAQLIKLKMVGWSNDRIAKAFGLKSGGEISNVLRYNGFSSWKLRPKGSRTGIPTPEWTEVELHLLRKGLERGDSLTELQEALPRRSEHAIRLKAKRLSPVRDGKPTTRIETDGKPTYYLSKPKPPVMPSKTPHIIFRAETQQLFSECERQLRQGGSDIEIAENLRVSQEFVRRHRRFMFK